MRLESALRQMIASGLEVVDFHQALLELKELNTLADSGRKALRQFLAKREAVDLFFEIGEREIYHTSFSDITVTPCPGAVGILAELSECHTLALVTVGEIQHQADKMKSAGIDSTVFSKIAVCPTPNKGPYYQEIAEALNFAPSQILVCGDRISVDLSPAKALGCKTVHVRSGRGQGMTGCVVDVDYTISSLVEIKEIVSRLVFSPF